MTPLELEWDLGDHIRKAVAVAKKRKEELADELDISVGTLNNWIAGRSTPSRADLMALAVSTGVPYDWLAGPVPKGPRGTSRARKHQGRRHFTDNKKYGDNPLQVAPETHSYLEYRRQTKPRLPHRWPSGNRKNPLDVPPIAQVQKGHARRSSGYATGGATQ